MFKFSRMSLRLFGRDARGNVGPIFALTLLPILFAVGSAVDYSAASGAKSSLQEALDSALIAGAGETDSTQKTATAQKWLAASWMRSYPLQNISFVQAADGGIEGSASAAVPASFMKIAGIDSIVVSASAKSTVPGKMGPCLHALDPTITGLTLSGSAAIVATGCTVQINSAAAKAVSMSGSSYINSGANCFVGTLANSSSGAVTPAPTKPCASVVDPFASLPRAVVGACDYVNYKVSSTTATLQPGVYCGGLTIASSVANFNPGTYIIKDGLLTGSGGSSFYGTGVSFYLTGTGAGATISGGGNIHLVASSTGPAAGFVFFLDSAAPAAKSVLSGTSELYYEGFLYFPNQKLELSGGSVTFNPSPFTVYIADNFLLSGASAIRIKADQKATSVKMPTGYSSDTAIRLAR